MKHVFEVREVCKACSGTGLYVGMAERDGAAVVCHTCGGSGCHAFRHEYEPFETRQDRAGVTRVFAANPGIVIGIGNGHALTDFGGLPVERWRAGGPFVAGTENRRFTCPAWWYQSADYRRKPAWGECLGIGSFSDCPSFCRKNECWRRFDAEAQQKGV